MRQLPLNKTSIEMFVFLVILYIIWFFIAYNIRKTDIKHSSLLGVVEDIHTNHRDRSETYIIFKNSNEVNQLSLMFNISIYEDKNLIKKGDSIHKQMFVKGYDVYRKVDEEYVYLYHINSER